MKHLDLFSGIGGFALAAQWAFGPEHELICFCEIDPFCQKVLKKHWPDVPVFDDIKKLKGSDFGTVELISGGFPCQGFSVAGKRKGKNDDRYLWPEMFRIIKETNPRWVLGENVNGIIGMALDDVLSDLGSLGYETTTFVIPACAVNAPHRRDRVWIVANTVSGRRREEWQRRGVEAIQRRRENDTMQVEKPGSSHAPHPSNPGLQRCQRSGSHDKRPATHGSASECHNPWNEHWYDAALRTCVRRVDDGVSRGMDRTARLRALGNAIVPQVAYQIFCAMD
jgi:DNA (cytosine-5)-methyltransferase 1